MIELTRCYRFAAAHVLARDDWSPEENERLYGKCANPGGHGHDYGFEVTLRGPVEESTGAIFDRERLDALVEDRVLGRLGHRMLNRDPLFEDCVPTAENIAKVIFERLEGPVAREGRVRLVRIRVHETRKNSFTHGEVT